MQTENNTEYNSASNTNNNQNFFVSEDSSLREDEIFSRDYQ